MPYVVDTPVDEVAVDPYGPDSPDFVVGDDFAHMWCSALAFCQERFCGQIGRWKREPSGGLGCFTPDSFPCSTPSSRTSMSSPIPITATR